MKKSMLMLMLSLSLGLTSCANKEVVSFASMSASLREVVGPSSVRVLAMNLKSIRLGQCVDYAGGLINFLCSGNGEEVKLDTSENLNREQFRYYSSLTDLKTDSSAKGGYGGVSASAKIKTTFARYRIVTEWARFRSQIISNNLPKINEQAQTYLQSVTMLKKTPYISAVDVGIAIRIIYDVRLDTDSVDAALSFGLANLATAVAQNRAQVELQYDVVGAGVVKLPASAVLQVSNIQQLMDAQNNFYNMIREMSTEWADYRNETDQTKKQAKGGKFNFGVISYEISDLPSQLVTDNQTYLTGFIVGLTQLSKKEPCNISTLFPVDFQRGLRAAFESDGKTCTYTKRSGQPTVKVDINVTGLPSGLELATDPTKGNGPSGSNDPSTSKEEQSGSKKK